MRRPILALALLLRVLALRILTRGIRRALLRLRALRALLRATGFREIAATEHTLRLDYGGPVIGLVFTARGEPRPGRR